MCGDVLGAEAVRFAQPLSWKKLLLLLPLLLLPNHLLR